MRHKIKCNSQIIPNFHLQPYGMETFTMFRFIKLESMSG